MVEAAMVLPIIILTILSMILLIIYFYSCLNTQIGVHRSLLQEADNCKYPFKIIKESEETSKNVNGVISILMKKEINCKSYAIREAAIIRLGDVIDKGDE